MGLNIHLRHLFVFNTLENIEFFKQNFEVRNLRISDNSRTTISLHSGFPLESELHFIKTLIFNTSFIRLGKPTPFLGVIEKTSMVA